MNLPNVFQNKKIAIKENGQDLFYGNSTPTLERKTSHKDIKTKIKELFSSKKYVFPSTTIVSSYVYKVDCIIETLDKKIKTSLVGQTSGSLITIDNELIPISEIIDLYEV